MLDSDTTPSLRGVDLAAFEQLYRTSTGAIKLHGNKYHQKEIVL